MSTEEMQTDLELEALQSEEDDLNIDDAPYEIRTLGADFSLELYSQKIDSGEIKIPEFQRKYVWPIKKASKLIESFLLNLPVPQVFLFQEANNRDLLVVDGQQRLLSVHYFLKGKFPGQHGDFRLKGVKSKWEGKTFEDLDENDKRRLKNYILRATIFEQINPADNKSVYEIFERLNTGGISLTEQEVRNAVNQGTINGFLEKLNTIESWRLLLGKTEPDKRMKDIEMILRFFALFEGWETYKKPMKDFISDYMEAHVEISADQQVKREKLFSAVCNKIAKDVGTSAFQSDESGRVNIAIFDSIMTAAAVIGPEKIKDLKTKVKELKSDPGYISYVMQATTNVESVKGRIKMAIAVFS